ncbi:MAG: hypothetical protein EOO11_01095 [Chitinophagaceae bacterium]|nr:MAG: hypothetical protein EOO11_01095 [Chitinophagaceae bacterium]
MKKMLVLPLLLLLLQSLSAQVPGLNLVKRTGGSGEERLRDIVRLQNGNLVTAGYTVSTDGIAAGNHGSSDFLLYATSPQGQLLWSKVLGGTGEDGNSYTGNGEYLSPAPDGGFFFVGTTASSNGDIPAGNGATDLFIARFDAGGNLAWKKTYGGVSTESAGGIAATPDGGCIVAGTTYSHNSGQVTANHGSNSADAWILKLSAAGAVEWSKNYGGSAEEMSSDIKVTADGGYIFAMDATSADGDLATTPGRGGLDVCLVKITATGAVTWTRRFGGADNDEYGHVVQNAAGDYFLALSTRSNDGDFPANVGLYDFALLRLTATGSIVFNKRIGGFNWDSVYDLVETADGNLVLAGLSYSNALGGVPIANRGNADAVLVKASRVNGAVLWANAFGGDGLDFGRAVTSAPSGELYLAGEAGSGNGDMGPSLGHYDGFILGLASMNAIKGVVYLDRNGNNNRDGGEPGLSNVLVETNKWGAYSVAALSENGNYYLEVDTGTVWTRVRLPDNGFYTATPDSFSSSFTSYYGVQTRNIGLKPRPGKRDLRSYVTGLSPARAGFTTDFRVVGYNSGTDTIATGTLRLIRDPRATVLSATLPYTVSGDTLIWAYSSLKPFDSLSVDVKFQLAFPPALNLNDWLSMRSSILPVAGDSLPGNNMLTLHFLVTGAYDPNDKREAHGEFYTMTDLSTREPLLYTVRFQNTGTDTAFKVVVRDTLDPRLDLSTFELLGTSHHAVVTRKDRALAFTFPGILLPDSTRNEAASHGFISYRIRPSSAVQLHDTIRNRASIYFDYNLPVVTNTAATIVRYPEPPAPQFTLPAAYCAAPGIRTVKISNVPGPEYATSITARIDGGTPVAMAPDSTFSIDPAALGTGQHSIEVRFTNPSFVQTATRSFGVQAAATPLVDLQASTTSVSSLSETVVLTAQALSGGGATPTYRFSRQRDFSTLLRPEGPSPLLNIPASSLAANDNWFFVQMKTSDSCVTAPTSTDSINIRMTIATALVDLSDGARILSIAPNPFQRQLTVSGLNPARSYHLELLDGTGRLLRRLQVRGQSRATLHPQAPGSVLYLVLYNAQHARIGTARVVRQ